MNQVQEKQDELYKKLLKLNEKKNPEPFTFWLLKNKSKVGMYRFNRGGDPYNPIKGYTDVGIVKVGSNSRLMFVGFMFKENFKRCDFRISNRLDQDLVFFNKAADSMGIKAPDKTEVEDFVNDILSFAKPSPQYKPFDSTLLKWIETVYNDFFQKVKKYDNTHKTNFYKLLKIDEDLFDKSRSNNEKKFTQNEDVISNSENSKENVEYEKTANSIQTSSLPEVPLNQILYGPPGTGKTYNTLFKALEIIEGKTKEKLVREMADQDTKKKEGSDKEKSGYQVLKDRYDNYVKMGQIVFTTFHQSMSYEDFMEGIKPKTENGVVSYGVEDGIFKTLCSNANKIVSNSKSDMIDFTKTRVFKMSLGEKGKDDELIFDYCIDNDLVALGWGGNKDFSQCQKTEDFKALDPTWGGKALEIFKLWMQIGDIVLISNGNKAIKGIAKIIGDYEFNENAPVDMCQFRKVKWLYTGEPIPISKLYNKNLSQQTIYGFFNPAKKGKLDYNGGIKTNFLNDIITGSVNNEKTQNYVLIIDEINRGNVSQIFGELITLLEEDKRLGGKFELNVRLPYSNEDFGVPSNLYIIGTMNTADRSVEALDTALRRRFSFVEMMPNPLLLSDNVDGINLREVLQKVNERIIVLKDREHQIGHSYFMECKTKDDIKTVFKDKIVPLLQEYFYGNYENIQLVLGEDFVKTEDNAISFAKSATYNGDSSEKQYRLLNGEEWENLNVEGAIENLLNESSATNP